MFRNVMLDVESMPEELEDFIRNDETIKKQMKILETKIKYEVIKISFSKSISRGMNKMVSQEIGQQKLLEMETYMVEE